MATLNVRFKLQREAFKKRKAGIPNYRQAIEVGMSPTAFSMMINGRLVPTDEEIARFVEYYGVHAEELFPN